MEVKTQQTKKFETIKKKKYISFQEFVLSLGSKFIRHWVFQFYS